jgi:hypothetical protein
MQQINKRLDRLDAELRAMLAVEWLDIQDAVSANFANLSDQELETLIDAIERGDDPPFLDRLGSGHFIGHILFLLTCYDGH